MSTRRTWVWVAVAGGLLLLGAGVVGGFFAIGKFVQNMAREPWALLHEAAGATRTDQGAEAFYRTNPGLSGRYPSAGAFVDASRRWRPKLGNLPRAVPDILGLVKSKSSLNVTSNGGRVTLSLTGYQGTSIQLVSQDGKLLDLAVN